MLLVIESRTDLLAVPADSSPRSTERALAHMAWPFPIDPVVPAPRRGWPVSAAKPPLQAALPQATMPEPPRAPRRVETAAPRFVLELAEVH